MSAQDTAPWLWVDIEPRGGRSPRGQPEALRSARPEEILAQPVVQDALKKAAARGYDLGYATCADHIREALASPCARPEGT